MRFTPFVPRQPQSLGVGLVYMHDSYKTAGVYPNPLTSLGNTNPYTQGVLWRQTWPLLEPTRTNFDWKFYDDVFDAMEAWTGDRTVGQVEILGGGVTPAAENTPAWFFSLPGAQRAHFTKGNHVYDTTCIWDPVLQSEIQRVMNAFVDRYSSHPAWPLFRDIKVWQLGHTSETFFVSRGLAPEPPSNPTDMAIANGLAVSAGYPNAATAWVAGSKAMVDIFASIFFPFGKKIYVVTGSPFPDGSGAAEDAALGDLFDYFVATYPGQCGMRSDDLYENKPHSGEFGYDRMKAYAPSCSTVGFQQGAPMGTQAKLQTSVNIALGSVGVHFIQFFPTDANGAWSPPVLIDAWNRIQAQ